MNYLGLESIALVTNETISACRFLQVEGSYEQGSTVLAAFALVSIITNEAILTCRFFKIEGSYKQGSTV